MLGLPKRLSVAVLTAGTALVLISGVYNEALASTITDSSGQFSVGVGPDGELYDNSTGVGFMRLADGFDPLAPGTPRDSFGINVAGVGSAYGDYEDGGVSGITSTSQSFSTSSGTSTSVTDNGVNLTQAYSFASPNVLKIAETVTNTSGAAEVVTFQRDIDWDVSPTEFAENTFGPVGSSSQVIDSSSNGFESADPAQPYGSSCFGGCNVTGDQGGGIKIALGSIAAGASDTFNYFYGISQTGQSVNGLTSEAQGLGAQYLIATQSSENGSYPALGSNSAFIGFGTDVSAAPEPSTWILMFAGIGGIGLMLRRAKKTLGFRFKDALSA